MAGLSLVGVPEERPDATAPDVYQRARPNPAPAGAFGERTAEGLQTVGAGLSKAGTFFGEVQTDDQVNKAFDRASKLLRGDPNKQVPDPDGKMVPDTGYMGLKGQDALRARPQLETDLDDVFKEARQTLGTPEQQHRFDQQAAQYRRHVLDTAGSHAISQADKYATQVNQASGVLALTHVANNAYNQEEVNHGTADLISARIKEAQLKGGGPELVQQAKESALRDALKAQLEAIAVKDPQQALAKLEANRATAGTQYDELANKFRSRSEHQVGEYVGEKAVSRSGVNPALPYSNPSHPIFAQAAAATPGGMSAQGLARTVQLESGGNPNAANGKHVGLTQNSPENWAQYGSGSRNDPEQSVMATARYSVANAQQLTKSLGRAPTDAELYLAHQQGGGGASKLLANPNTRAGDLVGDDAIRKNGGDPNAPAAAFTQMWATRFGAGGTSFEARKAAADQMILSDKTLSQGEQTAAFNFVNRTFMVEQLAGSARGEQLERQLIDASAGKVPLPPRETIENDTAIPDSARNKLLRQYDSAAGDVEAYRRNFAKFSDPNGAPFNPYDTEERKAVDTIYQALGGTPVALQSVVDRTGILPKSVGIEIQGALSSGNPERVAKSLTLASNLLAKNPNIFTKVDGKDKIENDTVAFRHYVDDLGMTAAQASQKMVQEQSPEYQASIKAKIKAEDIDAKIKKELQVSDVASAFDQIPWIPFTDPKVGFDPSQRSAMFGQYAELVKDRYLETGDWGLAKKQASEQLKKTWGVSSVNGSSVVMQYPPEKAPAYANVVGASEAIARQAISSIKEATGAEVERKGIRLQPIPGVTAGAYKAGNPPPYQVMWTDKNGIVQMLNPGKAFVADPTAMRDEQTEQRRTELEKAQTSAAPILDARERNRTQQQLARRAAAGQDTSAEVAKLRESAPGRPKLQFTEVPADSPEARGAPGGGEELGKKFTSVIDAVKKQPILPEF